MNITLIKLKLNEKVNLRKDYTYEQYVEFIRDIERTVSTDREITTKDYNEFIQARTDILVIPMINLHRTFIKYADYGPTIDTVYRVSVTEKFKKLDDYYAHALIEFHRNIHYFNLIKEDILEQLLEDSLDYAQEELLKELDKELIQKLLNRTKEIKI